MKKLILLIIVVFGVYHFMGRNTDSKNVSELIDLKETTIVKVTGIVKSNFEILGKGFYELQDKSTSETIMVFNSNSLPRIGEKVTRKLKKGDLMTFNDKTYSVYEEVE
jgi:hypothetical protein